MVRNKDLLICPLCNQDSLEIYNETIVCTNCNMSYDVDNNIPLMFLLNNLQKNDNIKDITSIVKEFYEESPFPNYEDIEEISDLVKKAETGYYAKMLNDQIPFNINVMEVGCGTGQLVNYLGLASRNVVGTDMCLNSLRLAEEFRSKNNINNTRFYQMNLFYPIFPDNSFHLVICQGVLHHTSDPYGGFKSISKLVKKGGYIIIGLYNKYGRLITDLRRIFFKITNDRYKSIDPRLRIDDRGQSKRDAWFNDQYKNPHESKHTIGEVLTWFKENNIEFVNAIPKLTPFNPFSVNEKIFNSSPKGTFISQLIVQLSSITDGYREGGLFLMIGKKI